jgi:hypothetical protein
MISFGVFLNHLSLLLSSLSMSLRLYTIEVRVGDILADGFSALTCLGYWFFRGLSVINLR